MELNADFTHRAAVHAALMDWAPSPIRGVERRMLDRIGDEVARATSIVRYAPGSQFSAHMHGGGEEIFVLEGVFQDEHGDFPAGSYIRNPPTSQHTPGSAPGCTILVKLWQFDPADRTHVRIDTHKMRYLTAPGQSGAKVMPLFHDNHEDVRLERWAANAEIAIGDAAGLELLVLDGGFVEVLEAFVPQSWLRLPPGETTTVKAGPNGCSLWVKSGHLSSVLPAMPYLAAASPSS